MTCYIRCSFLAIDIVTLEYIELPMFPPSFNRWKQHFLTFSNMFSKWPKIFSIDIIIAQNVFGTHVFTKPHCLTFSAQCLYSAMVPYSMGNLWAMTWHVYHWHYYTSECLKSTIAKSLYCNQHTLSVLNHTMDPTFSK